MQKQIIKILKGTTLSLLLSMSFVSVSASWTAPTNSAPNNNATGYIDTSTSNQTKAGLLGAGNFYSNNNIYAGPNSFSQNYPGSLTGGSVATTWFCLPIDTTGGASGTGAITFIKKILSIKFVNAASTSPSPNADCITKWADILTNNNILSLPTGTILGQTLYWDTTAPAKWKVNNIFKINPTTNVASVTGKLDVSSDVTLNGNIIAPTLASKTLCTDATGKFIACAGGTANPGGVLPVGSFDGQTLYWEITSPTVKLWKATDILRVDNSGSRIITKNAQLHVHLFNNTGLAGTQGIFMNSSSDNVNSTIISNKGAFAMYAQRAFSGNPAGSADVTAQDYKGRDGTFSSLASANNPGVNYPALVCKDTNGKLNICVKQCYDNIDNDGDGNIDFPNDAGCTSRYDNDEFNAIYQCSDGIDNDGDTFIDLTDPGCSDPTDNDETHAPVVDLNLTDLNGPSSYSSFTPKAAIITEAPNVTTVTSYFGIPGHGWETALVWNITKYNSNTVCTASAKLVANNIDVSVSSNWTGIKNHISGSNMNSSLTNSFGTTRFTLTCDEDGNPLTTGDIGSDSVTVQIKGSFLVNNTGNPGNDVNGSFGPISNVPTFNVTLIGPGGAGAAYPNNGADGTNTILQSGTNTIAIAHGGSGGGNSASCGTNPSAPCGGTGWGGSSNGSFGSTNTKGCGGTPGGGAPLCAGASLNSSGTKNPGYGGNGQINNSGGGGAGAKYINGVLPNPGTVINYIIGHAGVGFGNVNDGGPGDIKISW